MFDINAHIAFEEATGESLVVAIRDISRGMGEAKTPPFSMIRALLWAGLRSETLDRDGNETEGTLSLHQLGSMLDLGSMMELLQEIAEAFAVSMNGIPQSTNPQKAPVRKSARRR